MGVGWAKKQQEKQAMAAPSEDAADRPESQEGAEGVGMSGSLVQDGPRLMQATESSQAKARRRTVRNYYDAATIKGLTREERLQIVHEVMHAWQAASQSNVICSIFDLIGFLCSMH
jgi:hypothetical protein